MNHYKDNLNSKNIKTEFTIIEFVSGLMNYLRESGNTERFKELMDEGLEFFNQPFSTNMLVNPYKTGESILGAKWREYESFRLFDGWEKINKDYYYEEYCLEYQEDTNTYFLTHGETLVSVSSCKTLNSFLTMFEDADTLKWKK